MIPISIFLPSSKTKTNGLTIVTLLKFLNFSITRFKWSITEFVILSDITRTSYGLLISVRSADYGTASQIQVILRAILIVKYFRGGWILCTCEALRVLEFFWLKSSWDDVMPEYMFNVAILLMSSEVCHRCPAVTAATDPDSLLWTMVWRVTAQTQPW